MLYYSYERINQDVLKLQMLIRFIRLASIKLVIYCIFILLILAIAGFPIFILFFNKFYINCMLAQNNGLSIVILLIIITLLAAN